MILVDFYQNMVPSDRNPGGVAGAFILWPIPAINGSIKFQVDEKPAASSSALVTYLWRPSLEMIKNKKGHHTGAVIEAVIESYVFTNSVTNVLVSGLLSQF